jgi:hypothetical protein
MEVPIEGHFITAFIWHHLTGNIFEPHLKSNGVWVVNTSSRPTRTMRDLICLKFESKTRRNDIWYDTNDIVWSVSKTAVGELSFGGMLLYPVHRGEHMNYNASVGRLHQPWRFWTRKEETCNILVSHFSAFFFGVAHLKNIWNHHSTCIYSIIYIDDIDICIYIHI